MASFNYPDPRWKIGIKRAETVYISRQGQAPEVGQTYIYNHVDEGTVGVHILEVGELGPQMVRDSRDNPRRVQKQGWPVVIEREYLSSDYAPYNDEGFAELGLEEGDVVISESERFIAEVVRRPKFWGEGTFLMLEWEVA